MVTNCVVWFFQLKFYTFKEMIEIKVTKNRNHIDFVSDQPVSGKQEQTFNPYKDEEKGNFQKYAPSQAKIPEVTDDSKSSQQEQNEPELNKEEKAFYQQDVSRTLSDEEEFNPMGESKDEEKKEEVELVAFKS